MQGYTARGLKFKFMGKSYRVWLRGMEIDDGSGGYVIFFPWHRCHKWRLINKVHNFIEKIKLF